MIVEMDWRVRAKINSTVISFVAPEILIVLALNSWQIGQRESSGFQLVSPVFVKSSGSGRTGFETVEIVDESL